MKYFEDFVVGETYTTNATYAVTEAEIIEFGRRWDPQPFHTDPEAARDSIFGGLVASSAHLFAIYVWFSKHFDTEPVAAVSALGFNDVKLHAPVRPGDQLIAKSLTTATRRSRSKLDCGIIEASAQIFNQSAELAFTASNAFLVRCRQPSAQESL